MGVSRLNAGQIVAWFNASQQRPPGSMPRRRLSRTWLAISCEEGAAEGVTGDVAFMQSVVETGWFRFGGSCSGRPSIILPASVRPMRTPLRRYSRTRGPVSARRFSTCGPMRIQGRRTCTMPPLGNPCVDPRFHLVTPKGKAPTWNQMGNGNWATASTYADSILSLYREALAFNGLQ